MALDARADLVFAGWNYGFGEDNGLTPAALKKLGIGSYVLTESCHNGTDGGARGVMPPLEALYTDLTTLGKIFGVEDRAEALVKKYKKQVADAAAKAPHPPAVRPSSSTTTAATSRSPRASTPDRTTSSPRPAATTS